MRPIFLPFALPDTDETEIQEIAEAVRSGWITIGPKIEILFGSRIDAISQWYNLHKVRTI